MWHEVEQFAQAFYSKTQSNAVISNICKPAVERWRKSYGSAIEAYKHCLAMLECSKSKGWTQADLAKRLNVSQQSVSRMQVTCPEVNCDD